MKNKFLILFSLFFVAIFLGCADKNAPLADLSLPQDANFYLQQNQDLNLTPQILEKLKENYLKNWYSPWTSMKVNLDKNEVFWIAPSLLKNPGYDESLKKNSLEYTTQVYKSMDMENYPSVTFKAIITTDTNVRAVPTDKPRYNTPSGYPFDRWQNSLIFAGTPVLITHFDLTKQWVHIQSSFVYGWVKITDIARIHKKDEDLLLSLKDYTMANDDKIPLYDKRDQFLTQARVGELFALVPIQKNDHAKNIKSTPDKKMHQKIDDGLELSVFTYKKDLDGYAVLIPASIKNLNFSSFPKKLDSGSIARIINAMMGQRYGWGGALENRDCSAFTRDSFANFGILLPRNSAAQAKYAKNMIELNHLNPKEKEKYIITHSTPFATILWLKGHIMLYIGTYEGKAIVAHSAWSITTSKLFSKNENILGGVVITTLWVGKEKNGIFSHQKMLIDRVLGMSDLYDFALKTQDRDDATSQEN